ncbi:hypothetical protein DNFV4_04502 [Nitrospira tepida]|uniref:Uncharacterized protein n=1 Tax=Nitrospira tepida TaxID=2973512 RepID=A0AA86N3A8_9BACT|nr:hypothetical protein DNFV4_04502 [Nitrospira tepida]
MEAAGMARRSKHEYLRVMWQRYQRAGRRERSALLDEVTRVCRYHRKYAIGLLSRAAPPRPPVRRVIRRRPTYGEPVKGHPNFPSYGHRKLPTLVTWSWRLLRRAPNRL